MKLPEPSALVPHRGDALLLDTIDESSQDGLVASLLVRGQPPFASCNGALPAWTGPEIMAQAISAFATLRKGPPYLPKPGLLLGVRRFRSALTEFPRGARIAVSVRESTRDDAGSAVFDSLLTIDGAQVAQGMLTVFEPDDVFEALSEQLG